MVSVILYTELALGQAFFLLAFLYISSTNCTDRQSNNFHMKFKYFGEDLALTPEF